MTLVDFQSSHKTENIKCGSQLVNWSETNPFFLMIFFLLLGHSNGITTARTTVTTMMSIKKLKMFFWKLNNWNSILYLFYCQKKNTLCHSVRNFVTLSEKHDANQMCVLNVNFYLGSLDLSKKLKRFLN